MRNKSFWVMSSSFCSNEDLKTLSLLYQPLIGTDALGCYLMLSNLVNPTNHQTDVYQIQYILDILNFNEEKLLNSLDKLSAIGLLTIFLKDDIYLFRVNMPHKASQFFLSTILGPYLKSEVGEENFNTLLGYFSVEEVSKKGYKNITKSFDEVYTTKTFDPLRNERFILGRKNSEGIIIKDAFDFESFFELLPVRLKKKSIFTKKAINQIASVKYVYNFTDEDMIKILSGAYDEDNKKVFVEKIGLLSVEYFDKNYGDKVITFEKAPEVENEFDLASLTPKDFIVTFAGKMTNNSASLNTMREFYARNAVDVGLLNGAILASIKYTDTVPSIVYLEKVLADWLARGIKTGKDAMKIIELINEKPKSRKTRARKADDEPEWLDEILESLKEE